MATLLNKPLHTMDKDRSNEYTFVDLFAGAGGFSEGMLLAGDQTSRFRLVVASDIHPNAGLTHQHRFRDQLNIPYSFIVEDIRSETFLPQLVNAVQGHTGRTTVDVIVGGPPCQGFAVFGPRREADPRNDLFLFYLKAVQALQPKYFILENVPGMEVMYDGKTVERIHQEVAKLQPTRYGVTGPIRINAVDFGVPQIRERVVFIGYRTDMQLIDHVPATHNGRPITVHEAIDDLAFLNTWEKAESYAVDHPPTSLYQLESRQGRLFSKLGIRRSQTRLINHETARHTPQVIARFAMIEPGQGLDSIPEALWKAHLETS